MKRGADICCFWFSHPFPIFNSLLTLCDRIKFTLALFCLVADKHCVLFWYYVLGQYIFWWSWTIHTGAMAARSWQVYTNTFVRLHSIWTWTKKMHWTNLCWDRNKSLYCKGKTKCTSKSKYHAKITKCLKIKYVSTWVLFIFQSWSFKKHQNSAEIRALLSYNKMLIYWKRSFFLFFILYVKYSTWITLNIIYMYFSLIRWTCHIFKHNAEFL